MSVGVAGADVRTPGKEHVVEGQVILTLPNEEGAAQITFDWMFLEKDKTDPRDLFGEFQPQDLKLDEGDMVLKMLQTPPRYADNFATRVWMQQAPIPAMLSTAWDILSLNDTVGPIFDTTGNFYDVWNETESMGVVQNQEGIRNISTLLGSGITRKTNADNIVEGYVKEN